MHTVSQSLLRMLPPVGEVLERDAFRQLIQVHPRERVKAAVQAELERLRRSAVAGTVTIEGFQEHLDDLPHAVALALQREQQPSLRRVINATGVLLQTNLGRAPLSAEALARVTEVARGYCNLEFDLRAGERSKRDVHAEELLLQVLAARSDRPAEHFAYRHAAVVNNCAAATLLALNTVAEGGEVIVSRGELVEIGGGFRVPDILRKAGATLREVGTTNRTRVRDYEDAITPHTRLILRVHRSNFRIEGFTAQPSLQELIDLGQRTSLPVFEDQGTGALVDLDSFGMHGESSFLASVGSDLSLVACSGDKLLGGPQCGLLVGTRVWIDRIRANPLFRALRVDKMTYAALQATLHAYLREDLGSLPLLRAMRSPAAEIERRCEAIASALAGGALHTEVVAVQSVVGGGTTPGASLPSFAVALRHAALPEGELAAALRALATPVIARTHKGAVLLDLRSVPAAEDEELLRLLRPFTAETSTSSSSTEPR